MTSDTLEIPIDPVLGDWRKPLEPARVLEACRDQLTRARADERRAWRDCRMIEALYHPGRYLRVAYVLLADPQTPESRWWPEGRVVYLHAPPREPVSRRGELLQLDDRTAEAYCFPNDRRLRGIRRFAGREDVVALLEAWNEGVRFAPESLQRLLVRYVPEQKFVIRVRAQTNTVGPPPEKRRFALRAASREACTTLCARHTALAAHARQTDGVFQTPAVVGVDPELGLLGVEWIRGDSLLETLRTRDPLRIVKRVAEILDSVHRCEIDDLPLLGPEQLRTRFEHAIDDLAAVCPALVAPLTEIRARLSASLDALSCETPVTLHNDFHWNQLRIKRQRFALLDLERMSRGNPLVDVANFVTQIRALGQRPEHAVEPQQAGAWATAFLDAWLKRCGRIDPASFRVLAALSRLELARGMMRHLRPGWRSLAESCVSLTADELERSANEAAFA